MVRLYVNVQFQVKPLSTGTSSSQTKKNVLKNTSMGPPKVCAKFGVSSTSLSKTSNFKSNHLVQVQVQVEPKHSLQKMLHYFFFIRTRL